MFCVLASVLSSFFVFLNAYLIFQKKSKAKKARQCSPEADDPSLCFHCKQKLDDNSNLVFFENPPEGAKGEFEALFDPSLNMADLFGGGGGGGGGGDDGKGSKLLILITSKKLRILMAGLIEVI